MPRPQELGRRPHRPLTLAQHRSPRMDSISTSAQPPAPRAGRSPTAATGPPSRSLAQPEPIRSPAAMVAIHSPVERARIRSISLFLRIVSPTSATVRIFLLSQPERPRMQRQSPPGPQRPQPATQGQHQSPRADSALMSARPPALRAGRSPTAAMRLPWYSPAQQMPMY